VINYFLEGGTSGQTRMGYRYRSDSITKAMSMLKSGKLQSLPDVDGECLLDTVMSVLHFSLNIAGPYYGERDAKSSTAPGARTLMTSTKQ